MEHQRSTTVFRRPPGSTSVCQGVAIASSLKPTEIRLMIIETPKIVALARTLMALLFLIAGMRKVLGYTAMLGYFGSIGIPMPEVVLPLTILLEVGGGIALIVGWRLQWVGAVLAVFTLATAILAHAFWNSSDAQYSGQLNNFLKNVAIFGGFLLLILQARTATRD
jgi:putative oxidoreductase